MIHYKTSAEFAGEATEVLRSAMAKLAANGFKLQQVVESGVEMTSPLMNSTRQHPLVGASRVVLRILDNRLEIDAELGGVDRMHRFLHWFPAILGLSIGILNGVIGLIMGQVFGVGFFQGMNWLVTCMSLSMLPIVPWLVLAPLMSRRIRKRTEAALDALAQQAN